MKSVADKLEDLRDKDLREFLSSDPPEDVNFPDRVAELIRDMAKEREK